MFRAPRLLQALRAGRDVTLETLIGMLHVYELDVRLQRVGPLWNRLHCSATAATKEFAHGHTS
ncbi:MAG: hypothetical protein MUD01_12015 [Chloroflexaceae bacterium]|nr:hypothetical protein [Chloroflexaceae bacterium]